MSTLYPNYDAPILVQRTKALLPDYETVNYLYESKGIYTTRTCKMRLGDTYYGNTSVNKESRFEEDGVGVQRGYSIKFHDTKVIYFWSDGTIHIPDPWQSPTTFRRIHDLLGVTISCRSLLRTVSNTSRIQLKTRGVVLPWGAAPMLASSKLQTTCPIPPKGLVLRPVATMWDALEVVNRQDLRSEVYSPNPKPTGKARHVFTKWWGMYVKPVADFLTATDSIDKRMLELGWVEPYNMLKSAEYRVTNAGHAAHATLGRGFMDAAISGVEPRDVGDALVALWLKGLHLVHAPFLTAETIDAMYQRLLMQYARETEQITDPAYTIVGRGMFISPTDMLKDKVRGDKASFYSAL